MMQTSEVSDKALFTFPSFDLNMNCFLTRTMVIMLDMAINGVQTFMKENPDASADEIAEVVVNQQMASALKSHDKVHIFLRAVITSDFFKKKEVETHAETISKITQGNPIMQRHLISAVEDICADDILEPKHFPVVLKQLFDEISNFRENQTIVDPTFFKDALASTNEIVSTQNP